MRTAISAVVQPERERTNMGSIRAGEQQQPALTRMRTGKTRLPRTAGGAKASNTRTDDKVEQPSKGGLASVVALSSLPDGSLMNLRQEETGPQNIRGGNNEAFFF